MSSIEQKLEIEKQYSKYLEASSLLAHRHIGRLQAMLSHASYHLSDLEKEEIKRFIAEIDKERFDFVTNYKNK
jgi:hypothetical protein